MQADLERNYFELFDLPAAFDLDPADLASRYRILQQRFHPDRFASGSAPERRLSLQLTAQINAAYQTLKDPVARARYLLGLQGIETDEETDTAMDPAFLMEQMDLRESLADLRHVSERSAPLAALSRRVDALWTDRINSLHVNITANTETALRQARNRVRELQFLQKLMRELDELE